MWSEKADQKQEKKIEEDNYTFLGKGVDFKGNAKFDGTVRIDGQFEGEITTADTLIVGENAVIKGVISVGVILSSGKIEGKITASKKVQLMKPAVLIGEIHSPSFSMEEGVLFHGLCDMGIGEIEDMNVNSPGLENLHQPYSPPR